MSSQAASAPETSPNPRSEKPGIHLGFENTYTALPERFHARLSPTPVASPRLIVLNKDLARELRLDPELLASEEGIQVLAGNLVPADAQPAALAYAGHQFGYFVPQLGDGRAILLGEVVDTHGRRRDIQLKGSGRTPFSRGGDGRAALGPVLREYILSESMAALGVPTTRALAAVTTGEQVYRDTVLPGAVFTRVAASHIRVGTFQYFAARGDTEALRTLADYAISRHCPELANTERPYRALLEGVIARQAHLIAHWMLLGFVHGVMNTDNMSISGETIDYGPCAFLETYDPETVFSSIDRQGRYSYGNQPNAALWNLARLAEAMLPILEQEQGSPETALASAEEALATFAPHFHSARYSGLRRKLGLSTEREGDTALIEDLLQRMAANNADFTSTFRRLCDAAAHDEDQSVAALFADPGAFHAWAAAWRKRLQDEPVPPATRAARMRNVNPAVIPRNHLVAAVIDAAIDRQDFQPFHDLLAAVTRPYDSRPEPDLYTTPARPEQRVTQTFCGT